MDVLEDTRLRQVTNNAVAAVNAGEWTEAINQVAQAVARFEQTPPPGVLQKDVAASLLSMARDLGLTESCFLLERWILDHLPLGHEPGEDASLPEPDQAQGRWPDMLSIGLGSSGTTWLYNVLIQNDAVWIPPVKEVHFLDEWMGLFDTVPTRSWQPWRTGVFINEIEKGRGDGAGNDWYAAWRKLLIVEKPSPRWYARLFESREERIVGDLTPDYGLLPLSGIRQVASVMPQARLILMVRHPVDRAWSSARRWHRTTGQDPKDLVLLPENLRQGMGGHVYRKWGRFFPDEQIKVLFYEDMIENMEAFLRDMASFLDIPVTDDMKAAARHAYNAGKDRTMPSELREQLEAYYAHDMAVLAHHVGGRAQAWI